MVVVVVKVNDGWMEDGRMGLGGRDGEPKRVGADQTRPGQASQPDGQLVAVFWVQSSVWLVLVPVLRVKLGPAGCGLRAPGCTVRPSPASNSRLGWGVWWDLDVGLGAEADYSVPVTAQMGECLDA